MNPRSQGFKRGAPAQCAVCGITFAQYVPHHRCCSLSCQTRLHYREHIDAEHAKRAYKRAIMPDEKYAAKRAKEKAWRDANPERFRAATAAWHKRNYNYRWPVGSRVWYFYVIQWCAGTIIERPNNATVVVRLDGGTVVRTKGAKLRRERPEIAA